MLKLNKLKNDNKLILKLNDLNIDYYLKNIKKIRKYIDKNKLILELFYNNKLLTEKNLIDEKDKKVKDFITIMVSVNIKDKKKRYQYIYDTICNYLNEELKTNYCEFIDDVCIRDRMNGTNHKNGCCECKGRGKCKYLINSICTNKDCIACKLFTCKLLEKKEIKHNLNNYLIVKCFLTSKQKDILRFSYWTPKEEIIDRLMKNKYVRP